ncbi:AraC family transcriptional regulator [Pseudomonas nunensis]|uniref:AraC family transcriptional regulator n=1 Tax=Pseudomonas nunensis TaxID=2961896 RepID=UPI0025B1B8EF|nr:AraC family transcriptional regulator [Pseudomonas nunensis]MDN3219622.1 AraC family transcriptional regulator [Pseudomonas nunensis]
MAKPMPGAGSGLDLSRLCQTPVFTSRSRQESHRLLARELVEHDLSWRSGNVDTAFFRAEVGRCQLYVLRYGAEVEVRPRPFTDFVLMQMPLRGRASIECDGLALELEAGQVAVLSPNHQASLVWHSGCEQLLLKVPRSLLRLMQKRLLDEGGLATDFVLPPAYLLDTGQARGWLRLVDNLLEELGSSTGAPVHAHWLRHLEESLPLFLLTHPPKVDASPMAVVESPAQRNALRQLHRIEGLMRNRLAETLSLGELAAAGGMSVRSLNTLCQRCYGQTPMERLRNLRLEAVRDRLLGRKDLSITEVALEHGFGHLGRFARYYRERFGELPHQTASTGAMVDRAKPSH